MNICKPMQNELLKLTLEKIFFFVLMLRKVLFYACNCHKILTNSIIDRFCADFQFFVLNSGFFVLALERKNSNSLYRASESL